jgi:hypothetical protein
MDENKVFDLLEKIYSEVQLHSKRLDSIDGRLDSVDSRLDKLENEVKNNTIKLEVVDKKLETLSEIQKSYMEQNERQHAEIIIPMKESINVIELAAKNTSRDMLEMKEKFDKVEKVTIQNTYDVAYLKPDTFLVKCIWFSLHVS